MSWLIFIMVLMLLCLAIIAGGVWGISENIEKQNEILKEQDEQEDEE